MTTRTKGETVQTEIVEGGTYTYESAIAWPEYMNGAHVRVTKIFDCDPDCDGLTVAYDFWTNGGTTGNGTMHIDHARSVLKPEAVEPCEFINGICSTCGKAEF